MKHLNFEYCIGIDRGCNGFDYAEDIELSNKLYKALKNEYQSTGESELECIFNDPSEDAGWTETLLCELQQLIDELKTEFFENQENIEEYDPETLCISISIDVPEEWDEE